MDYEKAYKEALVKAQKELQCCGDLDCDAARRIFRLFPELRESEDERVRKEILNVVKQFDENSAICGKSTTTTSGLLGSKNMANKINNSYMMFQKHQLKIRKRLHQG